MNKKKYYLTLPIICTFLWALLSLIKDNFVVEGAADFPAFYYAGKNIFINPEFVYSSGINPRYKYLPSFASVFSLISLFDYVPAAWIYFFILLIFACLSILEIDKILELKKVTNIFSKLLILLVVSNGLKIMQTFDFLQSKYISLYLLLLFLRREIEFRKYKGNKVKIYKFQFIQFSLLIFIVGIIPFIAFIIPLYIFNNIKIKEFFNKLQLQKYCILIIAFLVQNFMFIIFPSLIFDFLSGLSIGDFTARYLTPQDIIDWRDKMSFPPNSISAFIIAFNINVKFWVVGLISQIFLGVIVLVLILNKKINIEEKFAYYFLFTCFFNVYFYVQNAFIVFLPIITLLYINLKSDKNIIDYTKKNYHFLIGLIAISILYFMPPIYYIYIVIPSSIIIPLPILIMRHTFAYLMLIFGLVISKFRNIFILKHGGLTTKND